MQMQMHGLCSGEGSKHMLKSSKKSRFWGDAQPSTHSYGAKVPVHKVLDVGTKLRPKKRDCLTVVFHNKIIA
jgi:hypothetical protein